VNWTNRHSLLDKNVTAESCKINCLLLQHDSVLFASPEQGLQHALDIFQLCVTRQK